MKRLSTIMDANGGSVPNSFGSSDYIDAAVLAANTPETHAIPTGAKYVIISASAICWVKVGGAAVIPTVDVTDGSASICIPATPAYRVAISLGSTATTIGLASSATCIVTLEFYS